MDGAFYALGRWSPLQGVVSNRGANANYQENILSAMSSAAECRREPRCPTDCRNGVVNFAYLMPQLRDRSLVRWLTGISYDGGDSRGVSMMSTVAFAVCWRRPGFSDHQGSADASGGSDHPGDDSSSGALHPLTLFAEPTEIHRQVSAARKTI